MRASFLVGLGSLRANLMRTILSTLGVIIGVASLVAILSVSDGLEQFSRDQIERTTDLHAIQVTPIVADNFEGVRVRRERPTLFNNDAIDSVNVVLAGRAEATLFLHGSAWISLLADTPRVPALLVATLPNAMSSHELKLADGRWLRSADAEKPFSAVVLSHNAAVRLTPGTSVPKLIGREVEVLGTRVTIVGVLEPQESEKGARAYLSLAPQVEALLGSGEGKTAMMMVKVARVEESEGVRSDLEQWLTRAYGPIEKNFVVSSSRQRIAQVSQAMLVFKLVMGAIAGISLIVGGIGIMNILLASVSERTREIGIRRAAGARASDILLQFLAESVAISGVGSLIGVLVGLAGSVVVTAVIRNITTAPLQATFTWTSILVAVVSAVLIGLIFGLYPARKASKLDPAEAIRYE